MNEIEKLTPNLKESVPIYQQKWRQIALNCEPIDYSLAIQAVTGLYNIIGRSQPEIIFYSSPYEIISEIYRRKLNNNIGIEIYQLYLSFTQDFLLSKLGSLAKFQAELCIPTGILREIYGEMSRKIKSLNRVDRPKISNWGYSFFLPQFKAYELSVADFCISELNYQCDREEWQTFELLARSCCAIYPSEKIVLISDRPKRISLDKKNRLHSELAPAIEFRDSFSIYAHHGVTLPAKYTLFTPDLWPSDWYLKEEDLDLKWQLIEVLPSNLLQVFWLLEETDAELRTRLIQRIGYERISQQLPTKKLDTWREYELLKITAKIDRESIHLLKMTCPSTNKIHISRVPPHLKSARKAIKWVNWNVDPEEFTIET